MAFPAEVPLKYFTSKFIKGVLSSFIPSFSLQTSCIDITLHPLGNCA
ncbi:hypothetical protein TF3313_1810 [Tannerella forsythia 3313]|nr:hypothetical protein TF3313_1810 [Tannerella forsythia 3313]